MKKWLYNICIIFFAVVFVASAAILADYYWNARVQKNRYHDLAQLRPTTNVRPQPTQSPDIEETLPGGETKPLPTEPQVEMVEVTDPRTGEKRQILAEFAQLYGMNSDIVGWMSIPAAGINYPVMQTPEDPEFYLRRNFDKEECKEGCLFVDAKCDVFAPSDNMTIYGHRMKNDTMFGQLDKFQKASFREENPYIYFDSLTELRTYEVMAVFRTTASVGQGFRYHTFVDAEDEKAFNDFVAKCKKRSMYDTGVDAQYGDQLICLSTCEYTLTNGRLVVVAKRVA